MVTALKVSDPALGPVAEKVLAGEDLSQADGEALYASRDLPGIGRMANFMRENLHGDLTFYNRNRHINYTNVCALSCKFCSFHRKRGEEGAYEMSVEQVVETACKAADGGATEIHIVGGLHPWMKFDYYLDMLRGIRAARPALHLKAFTAIEIVHFTRVGHMSIEQVLSSLAEAGLGSLPGGGAEIFDERVHAETFKGKVGENKWFEVHRTAHALGLYTNATMLYGHVETPAERVKHLIKLRQLQAESLKAKDEGGRMKDEGKSEIRNPKSETARQSSTQANPKSKVDSSLNSRACFNCIIPLSFVPDGSELGYLPGPTGLTDLKTLAISRLMVGNIPHIKAFWIMQTPNLSQVSLNWGCDDFDGTVVWYDITKGQGHGVHQELHESDIKRLIREAGRTPVERDTLYRTVLRDPATDRVLAEPVAV